MDKIIKKIEAKTFSAFSVIELLVAMIAISCLTAAFSPTLIRKAKESKVKVSKYSTRQCSQFGANCNFCTPTKCVACYIPSCFPWSRINVENCTCN